MKTRAMLYYAENLAHEIQARLRLAFAPGRDPREVVGNRRLIKKSHWISEYTRRDRTVRYSPAVANKGFSADPHPRALAAALCAFSSITGWPGLRMSRIWMSQLSMLKVAELKAILSNGAVAGRPAAAAEMAAAEAGLDVGVSYKIVECSRERRSNARRDPSAPTETKMSVDDGSHATSYTSRSCAMSWVTALAVSMFHTVHVVSMEEVTIIEGAFSFQEKFVIGAPVLPCVCTFDYLFKKWLDTITKSYRE